MTEITFDLAHLTVLDPNHYTAEQAKNEENLLSIANTSFINLFSQIKALPHDSSNKCQLPKPLILLPRQNAVPNEKPKTRWEQFVQNKGIKVQKKETKVFDKASDEWRLRYGYKRGNKPDKDWLVEVPFGVNEDPFEKRDQKKKGEVDDQKKRERRNKLREERARLDHIANVTAKGNYKVDTIKSAIKVAQHPSSSASMNQFNKNPDKPTLYNKGSKTPKIVDRSVGRQRKGKK